MKMSSKSRFKMGIWTEGCRSSPRISALELEAKSKAQKSRLHGTSFSTRPRKARAFHYAEASSSPSSSSSPSPADSQDSKSGEELYSKQLAHANYVTLKDRDNRNDGNKGKGAIVASILPMPEKHILELILDTLQKRDTHEIFAEPVDPDEVEDYYEIIKEPMDFGTMRAKLHESMYRNFEEFERDVLLISKNAMHFNSSGTLYFRQARAIDELAKRVFHVLKTDPENFESQFSETRRRSTRKPQAESKCSLNSSSIAKTSTNSKSTNDERFIKSNYTRKGNTRCSVAATRFQTKDDVRNGQSSSSSELDRRCTYSLNYANSIASSDIDFATLVHVNQKNFSYKESLMKFVKDLGPTAQLVAQRKLNDAYSYRTRTPQCLPQTPKLLNGNSNPNLKKCSSDKKTFSNEDIDSSDVEIIEVRPSQHKTSIPKVHSDKMLSRTFSSHDLNTTTVIRNNRNDGETETKKLIMPEQACLPYTYDLSYLKTKLDQVGFSRQDSSIMNQRHSSYSDAQYTDMAVHHRLNVDKYFSRENRCTEN